MKIIDGMQLYYDQRATIYDQSRGYDDPSILIPLKPVIDHIGCELKNLDVFEVINLKTGGDEEFTFRFGVSASRCI